MHMATNLRPIVCVSSTVLFMWSAGLVISILSGCKFGPTSELPYTTLLAEIRGGNVSEIEIRGDSAIAEFKSPPQGLDSSAGIRVAIPPDEKTRAELIELLEEHNVAFEHAQ